MRTILGILSSLVLFHSIPAYAKYHHHRHSIHIRRVIHHAIRYSHRSHGGWAYFRDHIHPSHDCGGDREVAASFYDAPQGSATSSGEGFDRNIYAAASPRVDGWSKGTLLRVRNPRNGRQITLRINDTLPMGIPYHLGVRLDLTPAAHRALGMTATEWVCVSRSIIHRIVKDFVPPLPQPRPILVAVKEDSPVSRMGNLAGGLGKTIIKDLTSIPSVILKSRPFRLLGHIRIAGDLYRFGSGGLHGHPSIPYGDYRITPNDVGPWGARHGALGINYDRDIHDPKWKRPREGIEIHAASMLVTEGCLGIERRRWPKAKKAILTMIRTYGRAFLHVWPNAISVTPMAIYR